MRVTFSESDLFQLWQLARKRDNKSIPSHHLAKRSSLQIHYEGLLAEAAVARVLDTNIDQRIITDGGDDGAPDLVLPDGSTLEVKYRAKRGWSLCTKPGTSRFTAHVAVLVWPTEREDTVEIMGWIPADVFRTCAQRVNYTGKEGKESYAVEASALAPISALINRT